MCRQSAGTPPGYSRLSGFEGLRPWSAGKSSPPVDGGSRARRGFFSIPFYSPGSDFIAFANTFLSDIIRRDLTGKGYRFRAFLYDRIFKSFFYGQASVYRNQYPLFGHHQVMPVKVLWGLPDLLVADRIRLHARPALSPVHVPAAHVQAAETEPTESLHAGLLPSMASVDPVLRGHRGDRHDANGG